MNTEEVKEHIEANDISAYSLLLNKVPNADKRFQRACRTLIDIMVDVKAHFPEATYYTASGGLHIVLGDTHSGQNCNPNHELCALHAPSGLSIGDGDW